jgi:hypothetical protein
MRNIYAFLKFLSLLFIHPIIIITLDNKKNHRHRHSGELWWKYWWCSPRKSIRGKQHAKWKTDSRYQSVTDWVDWEITYVYVASIDVILIFISWENNATIVNWNVIDKKLLFKIHYIRSSMDNHYNEQSEVCESALKTVHVTIFPYLFFFLLNGFLATSQDVFMFLGKS